VNAISVPNFLYPLVTCIRLALFHSKHLRNRE